MNHKEALQKIVEVTLDQSTANKIATEALQLKSRMYSEEEVEKLIASSWYSGARNHFEGRTFITDDNVKDILQSLQPKTKEQTYGEWMRSNPEQPTSPLGGKYEAMNNAYKEVQPLSPTKKEQPDTVEMMAEERYPESDSFTLMRRRCFIEGYKSNQSLEEFEQWYKETIDANVYTNRKAVLNKIQQLKNK